jgi:hypothetical protein
MTDVTSTKTIDFTGLEKEEWFDALDELAEELGHFEPLGAQHAAAFIEAGPKLVVTFESYPEIVANSPKNEPRGFEFRERNGWSHLAIIAHEESWFRCKRIYQYFDRLIDDGFFEDFEQVLFFGSHRGGYAASAYSVAAPGSRVLALRPVATQDPQIASWDRRYPEARRESFNGRFGYAPDMIDAADKAFVIFDPRDDLDAMQSSLFTRSHVTPLRTPFLGAKIEVALSHMDILNTLAVLTMDGSLDRASFANLYRERRDYMPYLRTLVQALSEQGDLERAAAVCRFVLSRHHRPFFARALKKIEDSMSPSDDTEADTVPDQGDDTAA